jgi:tRNA-2-methylthio-N6-dimethylallyladenosine synthase
MKFFVRTYGCQMNVRDSDAAAALLQQHGHEAVGNEAEADLLLVNTCSVRAKAEHKALGKLGLAIASKKSGRVRIVGAMGCMVERLGPTLFEKTPGLDFAAGTHRLREIPEMAERALAGESGRLAVGQTDNPVPAVSAHAVAAVSAFVNVLLGCSRQCAYCIVPRVRGPERSRPVAEILAELRDLARQEVREVTLLGQSVMAYGRGGAVWAGHPDSPGGFREPFARLLEAATAVEGLRRVRFTSGHPCGCTAELARALRELPKLCRHLHLPLQSGCDRILGLMRRGYTVDEYRRAVARLREAVPDIALTTDIIVGFPTESRADFEATRQFMKEIAFDNAFIFKYSPRPSTPAADWPDDVTQEEKMERNRLLLDDQNVRTRAVGERMVGRTVEVLAEGVSAGNAARWTGRTSQNRIVVFEPVPALRAGDTVQVRILRAMPQTSLGRIATDLSEST